jgi:tetratricopeptide (TPR) repeat protein
LNIKEHIATNVIKLSLKKISNLHKKKQFNEIIQITTPLRLKYPNIAAFHIYLANAYKELSADIQAKKILREALAFMPDNDSILNNLGMLYNNSGDYHKSEAFFEKALRINPNNVNLLCNYGNLKKNANDVDQALHYHEQAYSLDIKNVDTIAALASTYQVAGNFSASKKLIIEALKKKPNNSTLHLLLSFLLDYKKNLWHQSQMRALAKTKTISTIDTIRLHFAIGASYHNQKHYDKAYQHYKKANRTNKKHHRNYNATHLVETINKIKIAFNDIDFNKKALAPHNNKQLFFIVGLPRSGTTLTHQILSLHSKVYGAGEITHLYKLTRDAANNNSILNIISDQLLANNAATKHLKHLSYFKTDKNIILDKLPGNFISIGLIRILYPDAKVICCNRNIKDTALSIYKNYFENSLHWSNSESDISQVVASYLDIMKFWRHRLPGFIHDVSYHNLVTHPKQETQKLLAFCDLPWEDNCIDITKSSNPIKTASITQARQPIYTNSLNAYKNYEDYTLMFHELDKILMKHSNGIDDI